MNYTFMSEYNLYKINQDSVHYEISDHFGGYRILIEYPNGFGVSIVKSDNSYGHGEDLWDLAVLHIGEITYKTSMTDDVIGYLNEDEVVSFCQTIRNWNENGEPTDGWSSDEEYGYFQNFESSYFQKLFEEMAMEEICMEDEDEQYDE